MKHTLSITALLVVFFLMSQLIGILIINEYVDVEATEATGNLTFEELPYNIERPPVEEKTSFWFIFLAVIIGTLIALLIIRFRKPWLWRFWFLMAAIITLAVSFSAFIDSGMAFIIAVALGFWKVYRPNVLIHNLTELFIYAGIAAILVPIMNVFSAVMLLLLISAYDMYAVWKSKHMVRLAKFTTKTRVFAGLSIPYHPSQKAKGSTVSSKRNVAILGGGDIAFPLLFTGAVMKQIGMFPSMVVPLFTTAALAILLIKSKKGRFYPAMPFLTLGCFIGYGAVLLVF